MVETRTEKKMAVTSWYKRLHQGGTLEVFAGANFTGSLTRSRNSTSS